MKRSQYISFHKFLSWIGLLMGLAYLIICIGNIFLLDRYVQFSDPELISEVRYSVKPEDGTSKISRLHKGIVDERRKVAAEDIHVFLAFGELFFRFKKVFTISCPLLDTLSPLPKISRFLRYGIFLL
ncbi:MAG: hypothetical protein EOO88_01890 [Pedobacter sp.]|nr:MAG: hypothetical protein EOO88_01890 [Pedobacter sp.]